MSRFCLSPAPIGSLLKQPDAGKRKPMKSNRDRNEAHLTAIRRCPCLSCDIDPAGVAAHVRRSVPGKPNAGVGAKPDDKWTVPLCDDCHTRQPDAQHNVGEDKFWDMIGLDPIKIAADLFSVSPDVTKMRDVIHKARELRK